MSQGSKILLIEDSPTQAARLLDILGKEGFEAVCCSTAEQGLREIGRNPPDILVVDYYLPDIRGDEICRRLRMNIDTRQIPILMFTGEETQVTELKGLEAGADDYIPKSADPEILTARIRTLLRKGIQTRSILSASPSGLRDVRMLAIDDSPTYLEMVVLNLEQEGYKVEKASSGKEGIEKLSQRSFDCVLLDLVMPEMDGIEVCRRISGMKPRMQSPVAVLVLTAMENKEDLTRALEAGADDFVGKSSDLAVLKGRIRALLRRKFYQEENRRILEELKSKELEALRERLLKETAQTKAALADQLKAANQELERFFTISLDMVCIAGFDGYFKRINPSWEKVLGFDSEELLCKPYIEFVHPEDRQSTSAQAQKISQGAAVLSFENRYRCKDGSYRWLLWNAAPFTEEKLIYAAARDITERKRAEQEIQSLNASLDQRVVELGLLNNELEAFSYSVSHDLRAPLRAVDGFSQLLLEDHARSLNEEGRDYLQRIRKGCQRMGILIDDLLKLARIVRQEFIREEVDLSAMAGAVAQQLQKVEPGRRVEFVIQDGIQTQGDAGLLRVALENLLGNAWKFTGKKEEARIEFGAERRDGLTAYFIRDNGAGFDMAYVEKLFGAFQRLHSVSEFPGTGIGLATVQRVIRRHGGRLWAEGEVGKGAAFYFTLEEESHGTKQ